jgi:pimeloyl-ACP methyl ester carboxylesterase
VRETIVDRLLAEGYDVWLENWRGSLGRSPREYSLDEAAAIDHPAAVEAVARETGSREVKAVVHCLGSSGFMLALASGRLHTDDFEVTHVVSNAVSLHPKVPPASELKIRALSPLFNRVVPYLDPQWARDVPLTDEPPPTADGHQHAFPQMTPQGAVGRALVTWSRLTHYEAENGVSNFAQFMYGAGPSTLYDESKLTEVTARWMEGQFAWAPARLYRQIARSLLAGHLVPMREWPGDALAANLFEHGPAPMDTRITFITGTRNRCFSPTSQRKTYEWFSAYHAKDQHQFRPLEGFGHLDVWLAADQSAVHEVVLEGLRR